MKFNSRRSSSISGARAVHSRVIAASSSSAPATPSSPCKTRRCRPSLSSCRMLNIAPPPARPSRPGHYCYTGTARHRRKLALRLLLQPHSFEGRVLVRGAERDSDDLPVAELVYVHGLLVDRERAGLAPATPMGRSENTFAGVYVPLDLAREVGEHL